MVCNFETRVIAIDEIAEFFMNVLAKGLADLRLKLINSKKIDGRADSTASESIVIDASIKFASTNPEFVKRGYRIESGNSGTNNRAWYDMRIVGIDENNNQIFIPINVKVTDLSRNSADNLSCKMGMFYIATGLRPEEAEVDGKILSNNSSYPTLRKAINKYFKKNNKDYYFLVINKEDTSDVFFTSLRTIKALVPNGNNLPFQCVWNKNYERIFRTFEESIDFVFGAYEESIEKLMEIAKEAGGFAVDCLNKVKE